MVIKTRLSGCYTKDLSALIDPSPELGKLLGERAVELLGQSPVESYGKGGIAGVAGEQEHAVARITTVFGDALEQPSVAAPRGSPQPRQSGSSGEPLDCRWHTKIALYVRSHYDAVTLRIHDAPRRTS